MWREIPFDWLGQVRLGHPSKLLPLEEPKRNKLRECRLVDYPIGLGSQILTSMTVSGTKLMRGTD